MKANVLNFTERNIYNLPLCEKGREVYKDDKIDYLFLYITQKKVFYYIRKIKNRVRYIKIDSFPNISYQEAKNKVIEYNAMVLDGLDPGDEKKQQKASLTLSQVFEIYAEAMKHEKRTIEEDKRKINVMLTLFKDKRIDEITNKDLDKFHKSLSKTAYAANRVITLVSAIYSYAINEMKLHIENPAKGIKKFPEYPRKRFLSHEELKNFIDTLTLWEKYPNRSEYADLFKLAILTGARKGNILQMEFSEIDFTNELWTIPPQKSKNKKEMILVLSKETLEILQRRKALMKDKSRYVFPSPKSKDNHLIEPKRQWANLLEEANLSDFTIHDCRRTLASHLVMNNVDMKTVSEILCNSLKVCNNNYAHLSADHKKKALFNPYKLPQNDK